MINLEKALKLANLQNLLTLVKTYVDKKILDLSLSLQDILTDVDKELDNRLPLSGGTLTGNLTGQYITGTWLQGTAANHHSTKQNKVVVQDSSGWFYHRTLTEIRADMGAGNCNLLTFSNISVSASAWTSDATYAAFPYRAAISCDGVMTDYIPEIHFNATEATSGNYAPVAQSAAGVIYIYAASKPSGAITIPTIEARKVVK